MRKIVAGNWKMNGLKASASEVEAISADLMADPVSCDVVICPPATLLSGLASGGHTGIAFGGQDCHASVSGAHTGDLSAEMLADAGGVFVIVGHSERRTDHAESSKTVLAKAEAAWRAGLTPIVCIGETEAEKDRGETLTITSGQLAGSLPTTLDGRPLVIAYEPVWAIGTGRTPTLGDIEETHAHIHKELEARFGAEGASVPVLYGGSVKPGNAGEIFAVPGVEGGLVGGASLKAADFLPIIRAMG